MTQRVTWLVAVVLVVALLIIGGLVSIRVDLHPPRWAAAEFWTNAPQDGPLQPAFQLWVDLAKAARPGVVNVSTQSRVTDPRPRRHPKRGWRGGFGGPAAQPLFAKPS